MTNKIDNEEAKKIMTSMLSIIADYCETNDLRYYLAYGTLLGAIRHKGFIPWDNDIDIWMPRPDYNRLREMVKEKPIHNNIKCLDYREEKAFPFIKASDKRTILKEHFFVTEKFLGLYVDIFPLDGLPDNYEQRGKKLSEAIKYKTFFSIANYRFNTGSNNKIRFLKNLFFPISRLMNSKKICAKLDTLCSEFDFDKTEYVGNVVWGYEKKEQLKSAWFEGIDAEFEGRLYKIPKHYDEILKNYYGDYMSLPPEEQRITHYYDIAWKEKL